MAIYAGTASAQSSSNPISVDFVGTATAMGKTETAGVTAEPNWNDANGASSSAPLALVDSAGNATGVTVTWQSDDGWESPITDSPGNVRMMKGYLDNGSEDTTIITLNGLPSNSNGYNVYVYTQGAITETETHTGIYQISGTGIPTTSISATYNSNFSGTFTQANNSVGNYVVFTIPDVSGFTLSAIPSTASNGNERAPVNGIQIVPINGGSGGGNSAPTITSQPVSEAVSAGQTATFTVSATGTAPLSYQWYENGASISGATSTSYTTPPTSSSNDGTTFQVIVSNSGGSTSSNSAVLTVTSNTTPPTVSITSPISGAMVSGTITVTASASDSVAIASVQLQVDAANVGPADTSSPYNFSLDTTTLANGPHSLTALATDALGNQAASAAVSITVSNSGSGTLPGPLTVCTSNPRYFCDPSGNIVFLAGDHTWTDLQDSGANQAPNTGAFDFDSYMAFMSSNGYTWMRMWSFMFSQEPPCCTSWVPQVGPVWPWLRVGPGTADDGLPETDFTQLDPNYFSRLRSRVIQAEQNGIYVSVMLFSDVGGSDSSTDGDPFVSGNNVNGVSCATPCPVTLPLNTTVWGYEEAYIEKVVDTVHDLPNVMYEVANEPPTASASWVAQVMNELRSYESGTYGSQHPIGINYGNNVPDSYVYNTNADYVSPSTEVPPPATGQCPTPTGNGGATNSSSGRCKVVINDSDHSYYYTVMQSDGSTGQIAWAWENFALGNGVAFMDPYTYPWSGRNNCTGAPTDGDIGLCASNGLDPQWNPIRQAMGDIAAYGKKIDLKHMTPQPSLFSSGYGLASTSAPASFLMFSPNGSSSETITTTPGTYTIEVFDTVTHTIVSTTPDTSLGSSYTFTPPGSDNYAVWIH